MNALDFILIIVILIIIYKCYQNTIFNTNNEFNTNVEKENKKENKKEKKAKENEDIYDTSMKYVDLILQSKQKQNINPYLLEVQFHNDYRDTLNGFTILLPNQKQLFNRSNLPIINVSTPPNSEIKNLIKNFILETNKVLDKNVADNLIPRDWNDNYGEKDFTSGWDKQMEKLGLPGSIYTKPAKKAHIKLIKVDHSERFETEDEIRYTIFLVVQKINVDDQMVLKISFQIDKQDINLDRDFFNKKHEYDAIVKIEEVTVIGFLTQKSFGKKSIKSKYYDFGGITDGRMFSQSEILKILNKNRKKYENECTQ